MNLVDEYSRLVSAARSRAAGHPVMVELSRPYVSCCLLECFLLEFAARGVEIVRPAESWISGFAQRCREAGHMDLAGRLDRHATAEHGHYQMLQRDAAKLVNRLNSLHTPRPALHVEQFLGRPMGRGARAYIAVHEGVLRDKDVFVQMGAQVEMERLTVVLGPALAKVCVNRSGDQILGCMEFVASHATIDVGHSEMNEELMGAMLVRSPESLAGMVEAGSSALDAYGQHAQDCLDSARELAARLED